MTASFPVPSGLEGMGGVLDDEEPVPVGYFFYPVHLRHLAVHVNGQDPPCSFCYGGLYPVGVDVARGFFHVHEDRHAARHDYAAGGPDEGERCRYHLVPAFESRGQEGDMHGRRTTCNSHGEREFEKSGEVPFKLQDLVTSRDEKGPENAGDPLDLLLAYAVLVELYSFHVRLSIRAMIQQIILEVKIIVVSWSSFFRRVHRVVFDRFSN